jgi:hypothetical protein
MSDEKTPEQQRTDAAAAYVVKRAADLKTESSQLKTDADTLAKHGGMALTVRREFLVGFVTHGRGDWEAAEEALVDGQRRGYIP